jgi:hypothetical protein
LKTVSIYTKIRQSIRYIWNFKYEYFAIFFIGLFITSFLILSGHKEDWYNDWIDPFSGMLTLVIAIGLAINNYYKMWEEKLSKTLTVHYTYQGKYYLSCFYSDLVAEGDIRAWGLQLGAQMSNNQKLKLEPFFDLDGPTLIKMDGYSRAVKHYVLYMRLSDLKYEGKDDYIKGYKRWVINHKDGLGTSKEELPYLNEAQEHYIKP